MLYEQIKKQCTTPNHQPFPDKAGICWLKTQGNIVDHRWTDVIDGNLLKMVLWYDNEWGYSSRVVDQVKFVHDKR